MPKNRTFIPKRHMGVKLFQAIYSSTGKHINADDAPRDTAALCPYCSQPVILKRGFIREAHFAHKGPACAGAAQSVVHNLAISLLVTSTLKRIRLSSGAWYYYFKAEAEHRIGNRRVDVMLFGTDGTRLAVEICVTHPLTEKKQSDLQSAACSALEICLTDYHAELSSEDLLVELINETWNKEDFNLSPKPQTQPSDNSIDWEILICFLGIVVLFYWQICRNAKGKRSRTHLRRHRYMSFSYR